MIIAVIAMRMVKSSLHEIVDVVAMRDRLVTAAGAMHVLRLMALMAEFRRASVRILGAHLDDMLLDDVALLVVEMAVMKIVDMIAVLDRDVPAGGTVPMGVVGMNGVAVVCHEFFLSSIAVFDQRVSQACSMALSTRLRTCASAIE